MFPRVANLAILLLLVGGPPVRSLAQNASDSILLGRLPEVRRYLEVAESTPFSGVVLVALRDDVILEEARGLADAEHGVSIRTDDLFRIGSLTKPITASAVMSAVDRGRLSLDTRACDLLSTCPQSWKSVTVAHLLSHTSGIADHFGDLESVPVEATVAELERVLSELPQDEALTSTPGTEYAYSNFNYVLLGAVLERTLAMPWEAILEQLVFQPLGLKSMRYDDVYAIVPNRVRGYTRNDENELRNIDYDDHAAYAAGGLLSTARDLLAWSSGMLNGRLFAAGLVTESLTPVQGDYGFGWQVRRFFERRVYNHTGGIDGFSSHLAHYPEQGLTIVVLSNVENDPAILRACDVAALLFDWPRPGSSDDARPTPRQRCGLER